MLIVDSKALVLYSRDSDDGGNAGSLGVQAILFHSRGGGREVWFGFDFLSATIARVTQKLKILPAQCGILSPACSVASRK